VSAEDDLADTVVPRLMAANADLRMVETVNARLEFVGGLTADGLIELPGDVMVLHERLKRGDVRLVVLDPVVSFFGGEHSSLSNQDVRKVLDPLKAMAETYATTIVAILHLNKSSEVREWASRIAESHGFQAVARSVIALGPDPEDGEGEAGSKKVLALTKANLIRRAGQSMRLEIAPATVWTAAGAPIETSRVELKGTCDVAADDLLMNDEQRHTLNAAREWLEDYLGEDWRKVGDVRSAALKEGHHWRTIERARGKITKTAKQTGVQHGPWWMALATTPSPGPPTGGLDGLAGLKGDSNAATPPRTPVTRTDNGGVDQERQDRRVIDIAEWQRFEQRKLGERDDDD
jgi:putative DNA primase/helicase